MDYTFFEEEEVGGVRKVIDGSPYFKHIIEVCTVGWHEKLGKINEYVSEKNQHQHKYGKTRDIMTFSKKYFWKFTGCIILVVNYGKKGYILW